MGQWVRGAAILGVGLTLAAIAVGSRPSATGGVPPMNPAASADAIITSAPAPVASPGATAVTTPVRSKASSTAGADSLDSILHQLQRAIDGIGGSMPGANGAGGE